MRAALAGWTLSLFGSFAPKAIVDVGSGISIRESPGKGKGAFAARHLPAGSYLGQYTGIMRTPEAAREAFERGETSSNYFATIENGPGGQPLVVDAEDASTAAWPRYINHSRQRVNCRNTELNLPLDLPGGLVLGKVSLGLYVQTMRDIAADEELLIDYGDSYFSSRGMAEID